MYIGGGAHDQPRKGGRGRDLATSRRLYLIRRVYYDSQ